MSRAATLVETIRALVTRPASSRPEIRPAEPPRNLDPPSVMIGAPISGVFARAIEPGALVAEGQTIGALTVGGLMHEVETLRAGVVVLLADEGQIVGRNEPIAVVR